MNVKIFLKLMIIFIAFMKYLTFCCFTRSLVKLITFSKSLFKERNWAFWPSKVSNWLTCCNCWWYRFNLASISSRVSIIVKCKIPERVTQRYFKWIRNIFNLNTLQNETATLNESFFSPHKKNCNYPQLQFSIYSNPHILRRGTFFF